MRWLALLAVAALLVACGGGDDDDDDAVTPAIGSSVQATAAVSTGSGATAGGDTSEATATTASDEGSDDTESSEGDVHVPLAVGSSGEVLSSNPDILKIDEPQGTIKATIGSITEDAEPNSPIVTPSPGNKFWAVEVTLEATGDQDVNTGIWQLHTADGGVYETIYLSGVGTDIIYGGLAAGTSTTGVLVFDIPEDATIESLTMNPSVFLTGTLIFEAS